MNELHDIVRRFLRYSFKEIDFDYDKLTEQEKRFCTRAEFDALVETYRLRIKP